MKKFYIDYIDKSDDICHVWTNARDAQEALSSVKSEYWDIKEIVQIYEA